VRNSHWINFDAIKVELMQT